MNIKFNQTGALAIGLGALLLAGCDSVKDVRSEPATELPVQKVVLKGVINGIGGGRAITLSYNNDDSKNVSLVGADPAFPTTELESVPFSFGALDEGTQYNIAIRQQPFGKTCVAASGATGTLQKGQETAVVINCTSNVPRRSLTVQIPPTPAVFSGLNKAKVVLYTGEWMQERTVTPGQTSVTFTDALFSATIPLFNANGTPQLATDGSQLQGPAGQPLTYTVSASYVDTAGNESRCLVTNPTGSNPIPTTANPSGNVTNVVVGLTATTTVPACQFTMSGSVAYNSPVGGPAAETGAIPGGLLLEVRDLQTNVKASYEVTTYGAFTVGGATPTLFSSNVNAIYDIAVARQPTGRTCVVGDGGAASFYRTGTINPSNVTDIAAVGSVAGTRAWGTRLNVFCRLTPTAGRVLTGTYRLTSSIWKAAVTTANPNPLPIIANYNYDWTVQNLGSSNMLTFFPDGTFLYGTHAYISGTLPDLSNAAPYSTQVEHGFYDSDSTAATLRFTLITDTNPTAAFPTAYAATDNIVWNAARTGTPGLSAAPNPTVNGTPVAGGGIGMWTAMMTNVVRQTGTFGGGRNPTQPLSRIYGTFGGATAAAARLDWQLTEPQSINGEMTGTWTTRDNRRFWVWDYLTYYGTQVGVANGAPTMNDACFTVADVQANHGIYTRRGTSTGCYAYNRPARSTAYLFGVAESVDFHLTDTTLSTNTFTGVAPLATATGGNLASSKLSPQFGTTALATLPGFAGRIPGGQSAADGRSPSPVVYKIAPAATFAASVGTTVIEDIGEPAAKYFDNVGTAGMFAWCPTEILGIRATRNGEPINFPVYFCRTRTL
jgi:hypothetical protein